MYKIMHMEYNHGKEVLAMYGTGNKKMLNMLILEILETYSDSEHRLTQQEIIKILNRDYGMECDRRSVKANVLSLIELGYRIDIASGYYLKERRFENPELRLLIDGILCSKNVSAKEAKSLIDKLIGEGNKYFKTDVTHVHNLSEINRTGNDELFDTVSVLNEAISKKKKVAFIYNSYDTSFKLNPRKEEKYLVSPYQMVTANGFYYLVGNFDKYDDISHYRLDKITDIEILDAKTKPLKDISEIENGRLNLPKHMAEHIYMYSGSAITAKLDVPQKMMDELMDWFGNDFRIMEKTEDRMIIRITCNRQALVYWAMQYGAFATVVAPQDLREEVKKMAEEMLDRYSK